MAFRSEWKKAPVTSGVEGKWKGTWLSDANGHHGDLSCVVTKAYAEPFICGTCLSPTARTALQRESKRESLLPHPFSFFYRATWKTILSGSYKSTHTVQLQKDGTYVFKGEHKMPGWAGGLYHYEGTIKGDEFKANYRCAMDNGTYTMKRVR